MRKYARLDDNQHAVVEALRARGAKVLSLATIGNGCPDLLVLSPVTRALYLLEVKDGAKPAGKRKLTPDELRFAEAWGCVHVVESEVAALAAIGFVVANDNVEKIDR